METRVVKVRSTELGHFEPAGERLGRWNVASDPVATAELREAAALLRTSDTPVAFPTETVYGLGADATRSAAVQGIYAAKGRPSDNPLIIHVSDLAMLRRFLAPADGAGSDAAAADPIPAIYRPLLDRFWPGPLTILLPLPSPSPLAPEVTAGLPTFAVRMPSSPLALSLIALAGEPLAGPSANASTKPSPTAAGHVLDDLAGRIELILDAGPCAVGVESTVVDGLCDPPVVLRPGGVSLERLRACPGWERAIKGYRDASEEGAGAAAPRAPGMKYKHYSPRAAVVLYEAGGAAGAHGVADEDLRQALARPLDAGSRKIGVIRTRRGRSVGAVAGGQFRRVPVAAAAEAVKEDDGDATVFEIVEGELRGGDGEALATVLDIDLGEGIAGIAQGLFSALRELDRRGVGVIFVDGVDDGDDIAAAVMNRLRKAASETRT